MFPLIAVLLLIVPIHSSCPSGYDIVWKGTCIRHISRCTYGNVRNLTDYALVECAKDGGFPGKINNDEEMDFFFNQWRMGYGTDRNIAGVVCDTTTKKYHWADGSAIAFPVPTDPCTSTTLYMNTNNRAFYAYSNSVESYFNIWCYIPVTEVIRNDDCYDFDVVRESDDSISSCAKISTESEALEMAETECIGDLSNLASIHSKKANDFLRRQAASMGYFDGLLIGGSISDDGTFSWIDNSTVEYTNFAPGFPFPGVGSCVAMDTSSTAGKWINTDCSTKLPFACSRMPDAQAPECESRVYKEGDIIYSPGYPKNASEPCGYVLEVEERKILQLEILNLEANECCDHLTLHEGTAGGRLIGNLTGGNLNGRKFRTFASNVMHVSWQPNGGENVRGFAATFRGL